MIERGDAPLAGYLKLTSGYWRRIEEAETARQAQIESMQKATEELQIKNAKQREIREFRQRNFVNSGTLLNDLYIKYVEGIPGGFPAKNIDFTSINFLSLSFNHSTRNSFLLIPLVFIFISYLY